VTTSTFTQVHFKTTFHSTAPCVSNTSGPLNVTYYEASYSYGLKNRPTARTDTVLHAVVCAYP